MNWGIMITGNLIEVCIIYYYWFSLLERRFSKFKSDIIYVVVQTLSLIRAWMMFENVILKAVLSTAISFVLMQILFKDSILKKIVVYTVYMVCVVLGECVAAILAQYVFHYDIRVLNDGSVTCFLWQLSAYLFVFIFNIIAMLLLKYKKLKPDNKMSQYIYLYAAVQCVVAFVVTMLMFEYKITEPFMFMLVCFVLIASVLIGILLYRAVKISALNAAEAEYIKYEAAMKDKYFVELKEHYLEYRRLRHDFYNHIKIIEELENADKMKEYINEIKHKFDRLDQVSFSDNITLDALLSIKKSDAEQKDIRVNYEICSMRNTTISDFDLCTIFSNLLDNAITAAEKTDKKYISLTVTRKMQRFIIKVVNSSPVVNDLKTTKKDLLNHGIGIDSVRSIVEKYEGDVVFMYANHEFVSVVNVKY